MALLKLKKIILPNRDRAYLYLIQKEKGSNLYKIKSNRKYILDFATITLYEDNITIYSFDPAGGPYIHVGFKLTDESGDKTVKAILEIDGEILFMIE